MSESTWTLQQSIPSDPAQGCELIARVISKITEMGWEKSDIFKIHMAMEEAMMNAIKHGNQSDLDKEVKVEVRIEEQEFFADIADEGDGFHREDVPDPTLEQNLLKESGRGLMLIEQFMTKVEYVENGSRVKLLKKKFDLG